MRLDQFERLEELEQKIFEVASDELDPDNWPHSGISSSELSRTEMMERVSYKKNAAATMTLLNKAMCLSYYKNKKIGVQDESESKLDEQAKIDKDISRMEGEVKRQLEAFEKRKMMKVVKS